MANELLKAGFAVFRFDFRAQGESEGNQLDLTVLGEREDLESAFDMLVRKGYQKFGIVAASFAGGPVSFSIPKHQDRVKAVVFWNSALEYGYLLKRWYAGGGKEQLEKNGFFVHKDFKFGNKLVNEMSKLEPWKELRKIRIPILFINGDKDDRTPHTYALKYAKIFKSNVEIIHGAQHGFHNKKYSKMATTAATKFFLGKLQCGLRGISLTKSYSD